MRYDYIPNKTEKFKKGISHTGVLGMKWGVRRVLQRGGVRIGIRGTVTKGGDSPGSEDHRVASSIKKKRVEDMSNDELRKLTIRMGLERQYRDLKASNMSPGKKWVKNTMSNIGQEMLKNYVNDAARVGGKKLSAYLLDLLAKRAARGLSGG